MIGMDKTTGKAISGLDHLEQSIRDILQTPKGSRVMRRDYGSDINSLVDLSISATNYLEIYSAVADALTAYEPRLTIVRVTVQNIEAEQLTISVQGFYRGDEVNFDNIQISSVLKKN